MSLFSVLENEAIGDWWLWSTEGSSRKGHRASGSKQVMTRYRPMFSGSATAEAHCINTGHSCLHQEHIKSKTKGGKG